MISATAAILPHCYGQPSTRSRKNQVTQQLPTRSPLLVGVDMISIAFHSGASFDASVAAHDPSSYDRISGVGSVSLVRVGCHTGQPRISL